MRSHPAKKKGYVGVYADSRRFEEADEVSFTFNLPFEVDYGSMNSPALEVFSSRGTLLRDSKGEAPPAYSKDVLIFVRGLKVEDITGLNVKTKAGYLLEVPRGLLLPVVAPTLLFPGLAL
eukprot:RCo047817